MFKDYVDYNSISAYKICPLHFGKLQFAPVDGFSGFSPGGDLKVKFAAHLAVSTVCTYFLAFKLAST